jgi:preprotein translocase subunit Sss1
MNERLNELLPWYANGTISASDRAWVDTQLPAHPEARAQLRWLESLQTRMRENAPEVPADIGYGRALAMIRAEERVRAARASLEPSFGERVRSWFAGFGLTPALAAAAAIVAVQGVVIFNMKSTMDTQYSEIRSLKEGPASAPLLRVSFKPDAKEEEIRLLVAGIGGSLVGGPGRLGDYYIRTEGSAAAALDRVKANPIVDQIAVVDRLPVQD